MARLGHSTPDMAMRYQHATADRDKALADRLGALFTAVEQPTPLPRHSGQSATRTDPVENHYRVLIAQRPFSVPRGDDEEVNKHPLTCGVGGPTGNFAPRPLFLDSPWSEV